MPPRATKKPVSVTPEQWEGHWHLDKRVPVALIFSMLAQLFVGVWWASTLAYDVKSLQEDVKQLHVSAIKRDDKLEGLIALQSDVRNLVSTMSRLERNLDVIIGERWGAQQIQKGGRK